jgi:hypothetical protein
MAGIVNEDICIKQFSSPNPNSIAGQLGNLGLKMVEPTDTTISSGEEASIRTFIQDEKSHPALHQELNTIISSIPSSDKSDEKFIDNIIEDAVCVADGNESNESEHGEISIEDIGRRVNVKGYASDGTLRFYGKHNTNNDMRCGVEFDDAVGKNNGIVGGHQYFNCESGHGILCVSYKVTFIEETIKLIVDDNSHT